MKFINYLKSIAGIDIFPMISLFIFFLFFIGLIFYVYSTDRREMDAQRNIPLETED